MVAAMFFVWKNNAAPKSLVVANVTPFSGAAGREDAPAFSPDGKQIAYVWDHDEGAQTDVFVRLLAGGEPVRITETTENERYAVFSPDGSTVSTWHSGSREAKYRVVSPMFPPMSKTYRAPGDNSTARR